MSNQPDHGAECVKAYDEYAAKHFKRLGDVAVFGFDYPHDPSYGHVEILTKQQARHYRRQTLRHRARLFLARLADSVRGQK